MRSVLPILLPAFGLLLFGLSGIARGDELVGGNPLLPRQLLFAGIAAVAGAAVAAVPYRHLRPLSGLAFAVTVVLLLAVFLGPVRGGARRWIPLGVIDLQPSELAKLTFILALAHHLMTAATQRTARGLIIPFTLAAVPTLLILREPDLGTAMVFGPVLAAMLVASGARHRHLLAAGALGLACLPALWSVMSAEQKSRVTALTTQTDGGAAPRGDGYHLHQSKQVLAMGGPAGSEFGGPLTDEPLAYHLPAARTDFVYCLIGERWGLAGSLGVLLLAALLTRATFRTAAKTREPFGRLVCVGVATLLLAQVTINTAMTVGLMPITGLTLPLCSYGGSSLVSVAVCLGLVCNVALRPGYDVAPGTFRWETV